MFVSLYFVGQAKTSSCLCSITQPGQSTKALANMWANSLRPAKLRPGQPCCRIRALFAWLISHQSAVLFSQNKPTSSNQPTVLFLSEQTSHQPSEHADDLFDRFPRARPRHSFFFFLLPGTGSLGGAASRAQPYCIAALANALPAASCARSAVSFGGACWVAGW
jgi:hypothetical protein